MTKYTSEPRQFNTGDPETGTTRGLGPLDGDYAATGPYGVVPYGEGWQEGHFPHPYASRLRAEPHEYGVMEVSWRLPTESDNWVRFAITRSTLGAPASIEEGRVIIEMDRVSGMTSTLDHVPNSTSVAYSLFVQRVDGVWVKTATTADTPVVLDRNIQNVLIQAIPNHNFPNPDLERFLDVFAFEMSKEHTALDAVMNKHNAFATPQPYVESVLAQYGFGSVVGLGARRARNFLEALYIQRRHRGTRRSMETIASALAGGDSRVGTGLNLMHDRNHSRFAYTIGSWVGRDGANPQWSDPALADPYPPRVEGLGYLLVEGKGTAEGLSLPGTSGHYASTPDRADLDIAGDLDLRIGVAMDDWTPAADSILFDKALSATDGYRFYLQTDGTLVLQWGDGSQRSAISTAAVGFADTELGWVRATLDIDNGSGAYEVKFYTSVAGVTWTQLGTTITGGAVTSVGANGFDLAIGATVTGSGPIVGTVHQAQVYDAIDGTAVFDVDFTDHSQGWSAGDSDGDVGTESTGASVTIHGEASEILGTPGDLVVMSGDARRDAIPVDRGQSYSLSAYVRGDARNVRMTMEWLDIEGNVLPPITGTGVGPGPFGEYIVGAGKDGRDEFEPGMADYGDHTAGTSWERITYRQSAPPQAAFGRPGFIVDDSAPGEFFGLSDVQFEPSYVPSPFEEPRRVEVELLPHRTNFIRNPSMERGVYLWQAVNGSLDRSPESWRGSYSGRMVVTSNGPASVWTNTVLTDSHCSWSAYLRLEPANHDRNDQRSIRLQIEWLDENEDVIATEISEDLFPVTANRWGRVAMLGNQLGAHGSRCIITVTDAVAGDILLWDGALLEESTVVRQYFDGNLLNSSYYWAGEPNFSESHFLASKDAIVERSEVELLRWLPGDRQLVVRTPPLILRSSEAALMSESVGYWSADEYDDFTTSYIDQSGSERALSEPGGGQTPMRLVYEDESYVWLPGRASDFVQHEIPLDVDGVTDATITLDIVPEQLGVLQDIYGQWDGAGNEAEQNWLVSLTADDRIQLRVSDGTTAVTYPSTVPIASVVGDRVTFRIELVAGDVTFFENDVQLGAVVEGTFAGFRRSSARPRISGMYQAGTNPFAGIVYTVEFAAPGALNTFDVLHIDQEGGQDWYVERSIDGIAAVVVDEDYGTVVVFDPSQSQYLFTIHDDVLNVGPEGLTVLLVARVHEDFDNAVLVSKKAGAGTASGWSVRTTDAERVLLEAADGTTVDVLTVGPVQPADDLILVARITPTEVRLSRNIDHHSINRTVGDMVNTENLVIGALDTFGLSAARMEWKATGVWERVLTDDEITLLSAAYLP